MKARNEPKPAGAEREETKTQRAAGKEAILTNKKSAGRGDEKATVYPKKMGYHGKDPEKDLNPEE